MIARLSFLLPTPFYTPVGFHDVLELQREAWRIRLHSPIQSVFATKQPNQPVSAEMLSPAANPVISDRVRINDGETVAADLIRVDFMSESFDRNKGDSAERNRLLETGFEVINRWLMAYRVLAAAAIVEPVDRMSCSTRLDYLDDGGEPLAPAPGLIRQSASLAFQIPGRATITAEAWEAIGTVAPDYVPPRWDQL